MKLEVLRYSTGERSTSGLLFDVTGYREFLCYTLEDPYNKEKIYGKTRIPDGCYEIELLNAGVKDKDYKIRFPKLHKGMLWIKDVPNYEGILIHTGNTPGHTSGCLLVGDAPSSNITDSDNDFLGLSTQAYKRIYLPIADTIFIGEKVTINFRNFETEETNV